MEIPENPTTEQTNRQALYDQPTRRNNRQNYRWATRKMGRMDTHMLPNRTWGRKPRHHIHYGQYVWGGVALETETPGKQIHEIIPHRSIKIRESPPLLHLINKQPSIAEWITRPYIVREIQTTILHLKKKAAWADGIPGGDIQNRS